MTKPKDFELADNNMDDRELIGRLSQLKDGEQLHVTFKGRGHITVFRSGDILAMGKTDLDLNAIDVRRLTMIIGEVRFHKPTETRPVKNEKPKMIRIAIDLELHSDGEKTGQIIQLGYSIFDVRSREILFTGGDFVKTGIPLSEYIIKLTGITEEDIETKGVSLVEAYNNMRQKYLEYTKDGEKNNSSFCQIIEWGSGDASTLKEELLSETFEEVPTGKYELKPHQEIVVFHSKYLGAYPGEPMIRNNHVYDFGNATLNLKAMFQAIMIERNLSHRCGLSKALGRLGLSFVPFTDPETGKQKGKHDARADAMNTALLYLKLTKGL